MQDHDAVKDDLYSHFARIGKILASPKRLAIIDVLSQSRRSVEDVAREAGLTIGNASAHLKLMHAARVVERQREGQHIYYRLASAGIFELFRVLQRVGKEQIAEVDRLVRLYYETPGELEPVSPAELRRRLHEDDVLVIDVRPEPEYEAGHLPGAINIPPHELELRLHALPRDREIVAYCRGPFCLFSVDAVRVLKAAGYRARRLTVGLPDWTSLGLPLATSSAGASPHAESPQ